MHESGSNRQRRPPDRLDALTSLRFVAAACIVVHHTTRDFPYGRTLDVGVPLDQAVSFFFVLSGFILTYTHPTLEPGGARRFWRARVARLWPVHLATFLLVALLLPNPHPWWVVPVNLLLLQAWSTTIHFAFNGPSWSISTEAAFYFAFPFLVRGWARSWPWKLALAFVAMLLTVAWANHTRDYLLAHVNPLARGFEFVLGMTALLVWRRLDAARLGVGAATALQCGALAAAFVTTGRTYAWLGGAYETAWIGPAGGVWLVHGGLTCLPFAAVIVAMALRHGLVARLLALRPLVVLGEISFAIYMIHHPVLRLYQQHQAMVADLPTWLVYAAYWAVVLIASWLSWRLVERPCRRWLRGERHVTDRT